MDGYRPLRGQHICSRRRNRCPQPSPTLTPTPTSTLFPQHSTPTPGIDVTAQSTILHAADSTVSPVTNAFPDITRQALLPGVNTSGTGPQHAGQPGEWKINPVSVLDVHKYVT